MDDDFLTATVSIPPEAVRRIGTMIRIAERDSLRREIKALEAPERFGDNLDAVAGFTVAILTILDLIDSRGDAVVSVAHPSQWGEK